MIDVFRVIAEQVGDFVRKNALEIKLTLFTILLFTLLRFLLARYVKRVGRKSQLNQVRVVNAIRYISSLLFVLPIVLVLVIWGIPFREMLVVLASTFAVLGVALFATWSILSNVTAGVILFFYFPYKIGDRVKVMDKDFPDMDGVIIDIKAFTVLLSLRNGGTLTLPNNLLVQKGAILLKKEAATTEDFDKRM